MPGKGVNIHVMKTTKYLAVAFGIVVFLLSVGWFLRNTVIQRISNPVLEEYGVVVIDVSLDALAPGSATIGYLELLHDNGATIVIEDLTLPIGAASDGFETYAARKVSIATPTGKDGEPLELAQLIDQFLSLPDTLAGSKIIVTELNLAPYPTVRDLRWVTTENEQRFRASVESVAMSAVVTRTGAANYAVVFSLPSGSATTTDHSIAATVQQDDQGISMSGMSSLDSLTWEPIARLVGIVPQGFEIESGTLALQFDVEIPYDLNRSPSVTAALTPSSPLQFTYSSAPGTTTSILIESFSPMDITATFPKVEWTLLQAQASMLVTHGDWNEIPVSISKLSCQSGPTCSMHTSISMNDRELPFGRVGGIELGSEQNLAFLDGRLRVDVQPGAILELTELSTPDTEVRRIGARLVSNATLEIVNAGWRLEAESLDAIVDAMAVSEEISVATPLFLENVVVSELDQVLSARLDVYAPASRSEFNEQTLTLPGFEGKVSVQGADIAMDLSTVGLYQDGTIAVQHDLDAGTGQLIVSGAALSFSAQNLSSRITPWHQDWDLNAGTVSVDLRFDWELSDSDSKLHGRTSARIADLAGYYADTAFAGLSTRLDADYSNTTGFVVEPANIDVALIEMGLPIENTSADYVLDPNILAVEVENLRMTAFGGVITADPFRFDSQRNNNTLVLRAESIDLSELLSIKEFEDIEVSGSIGAELPVTISGDVVTIVGGKLTGEAPGGVIRYRPTVEPDESDVSSIGLVTRALSNFEYESLTSDVNYSKNGDLNLKIQLTGRNPDLDETRPIVLNLGVESNVPQMLKSLQAARAVEDILEKRLGR